VTSTGFVLPEGAAAAKVSGTGLHLLVVTTDGSLLRPVVTTKSKAPPASATDAAAAAAAAPSEGDASVSADGDKKAVKDDEKPVKVPMFGASAGVPAVATLKPLPTSLFGAPPKAAGSGTPPSAGSGGGSPFTLSSTFGTKLSAGPKLPVDRSMSVIVLSDDHNTCDGVATALALCVPGVDPDKGMEFARIVDESGQATVWTGDAERAEQIWQELSAKGLTMAPLAAAGGDEGATTTVSVIVHKDATRAFGEAYGFGTLLGTKTVEIVDPSGPAYGVLTQGKSSFTACRFFSLSFVLFFSSEQRACFLTHRNRVCRGPAACDLALLHFAHVD
jgi:ATP-dependent Clp protease adapter protein ClpS